MQRRPIWRLYGSRVRFGGVDAGLVRFVLISPTASGVVETTRLMGEADEVTEAHGG